MQKVNLINIMPTTNINPGEHLYNLLKKMEITSKQFAEESRLTLEYINDLVDGKVDINEQFLQAAAKILNTIPDTWLTMHKKFQEEQRRYYNITPPEKPKFIIVSSGNTKNEEYILCTEPFSLFWVHSYDPLQIFLIEGFSNRDLFVECREWYKGFTKIDALNMKLSELNLSIRCLNALTINGLNTIRDLCKCTASELLGFRQLGQQSLKEVEFKLSDLGVKLKGC
jgi:plasmid maintenance system antidote protein VapI